MPHSDLSREELLLRLNRVQGLEPLKALESISGQTPLYLKLVKSFADEQLGRTDELRQLYQAQDWDVLRRRCHSLKSYAAYIGAYGLSAMCAKAEKALANDVLPQSDIEAICTILDPIVIELRTIVLTDDESEQKVEFSLMQFKKDLVALLPLLEKSDFAAEEALHNLIKLTEQTEYHETMTTIFEYVDDVEYELAVERTKNLLQELI